MRRERTREGKLSVLRDRVHIQAHGKGIGRGIPKISCGVQERLMALVGGRSIWSSFLRLGRQPCLWVRHGGGTCLVWSGDACCGCGGGGNGWRGGCDAACSFHGKFGTTRKRQIGDNNRCGQFVQQITRTTATC